ncbi:MAG TPA: peptidoglycan binding domain-containing protein, partial [Candidatus Saccharimonadia bacterium]|nr:peptidoglycan binding domain-containing protein [Candidatus Saccharimonadia bacterium]
LTLNEARALIRRDEAGYHLNLNVASDNYELSAKQLGVTFDTEVTVASAYASGRDGWVPPLHHDPIAHSFRLDRSQLNAFANSVATKVGTPPVDAGLVVSGTTLSTVPEKSGWSIDRMGLERLIEDDVRSPGGGALSLQAREQVADIQAKALAPTIAEAKQLMAVPVVLTYQDKTFTPTPADIGQWLAFVKQPDGLAFKLTPKIDTGKLKSYINTVANYVDVAAVNKKITVENGVSKVTQEGVDGLAMDRDNVTAAIAASITKQEPLTYAITTHPVPFKTVSTSVVSLDIGTYIEINLTTQHLWVWQDHQVIYESPITSGATGYGFGTVTGLFSIYYKTTNTHLVGNQYGPRYNYDVAVKYWMPFYQGFGLHDASWRNGVFGGQDYYWNGSHGCVNLPDATAAFIYNWSHIGTPVWVHT